MAELAGLILAAGVSSRMGAFKPMLTVDGQTQNSGMGDITALGGDGPNYVEAEAAMGDIQIHFSK